MLYISDLLSKDIVQVIFFFSFFNIMINVISWTISRYDIVPFLFGIITSLMLMTSPSYWEGYGMVVSYRRQG